jgi:acylphosphatase
MKCCRRFRVSGRVQGVFYRAATQAKARQCHLTGWVRNLPDGCVELIACGAEAGLDELARWLWLGPPRAEVKQVVQEEVAQSAFSDFLIRD